MVSWGKNTVHKIGTPVASPAGGGSFGFNPSTTTSPAPAPFGTPAPGGFFGTSTTPAPSFGIFGTTPAPSGGIFGSTPAPSGGLFGSTPQQQQQQGPQIPADAALRAHLDASARNEEARVVARMQKIHTAYTSGAPISSSEKSHAFTTVMYNPATPQERQLQALNQSLMKHANNIVMAPRPPQLTENDWNLACIRSPDPQKYMPIAVVGADNLKARAISQQQRADEQQSQIQEIEKVAEVLRKRHAEVERRLQVYRRKNEQLKLSLLKAIKYVEVTRCFNLPLQKDEMEAKLKLDALKRQVVQTDQAVSRLEDLRSVATITHARKNNVPELLSDKNHQRKLMQVIKETRSDLTTLTEQLRRDQRDLQLIKDRVVAK